MPEGNPPSKDLLGGVYGVEYGTELGGRLDGGELGGLLGRYDGDDGGELGGELGREDMGGLLGSELITPEKILAGIDTDIALIELGVDGDEGLLGLDER